jgi:hypothetical protein
MCEAVPIKPPFLRRANMLRKTLVALAATASLGVGAAALTPAMANYDYCYENPAAAGCPGNYDVTKEAFYVAPHNYRGASHEQSRALGHHG